MCVPVQDLWNNSQKYKEYVSFINKSYIAVLRRLRSIAQHTAITHTYKIKAAGSQWSGEIMVLVFFVFCGVVLVVCNRMMYQRSFKLGAHKPSPFYVTTLYGT
jgi:hypothetical protein